MQKTTTNTYTGYETREWRVDLTVGDERDNEKENGQNEAECFHFEWNLKSGLESGDQSWWAEIERVEVWINLIRLSDLAKTASELECVQVDSEMFRMDSNWPESILSGLLRWICDWRSLEWSFGWSNLTANCPIKADKCLLLVPQTDD